MNVEGFLGSEEERVARRLVEQANEPSKAAAASVQGFVAAPVRACGARRSCRLQPRRTRRRRRAGLAIPAIAQTRQSPKIRFADPDTPPGGARLKGISVIEIVNDDMPFLVDLVMAELDRTSSLDPPCRASDPRP